MHAVVLNKQPLPWRNSSAKLIAKGVTARKAESLADLHRRRGEAQGQFYTPDWVCRGMWGLLQPAMDAALAGSPQGARVALLDNSVGSGRLFQYADPEKHALYGCDIDPDCIDALNVDAGAAGFRFEFEAAGMEQVKARSFGASLINPPFGLHLEHPQMQPYPSTCYGRFGPNTSTNSHLYALDHALSAAPAVIALLPITAREECLARNRLIAEILLPGNTFTLEGAAVQTAVYVFGKDPNRSPVRKYTVEEGDDWPELDLQCISDQTQSPKLTVGGVDISEPVITTPVTGNARVVLHHHNRRLKLRFNCGLVEAKVMNGLLRDTVAPSPDEFKRKHRYPSEIRFQGDGLFLLDTYPLQEDPEQAFQSTIEKIRELGGSPQVSATLMGYWNKLLKRHQRARAQFRHTVKRSGVDDIKVTAKRGMLLETGNVRSPVIRKGEVVSVMPLGGDYVIEKDGFSVQYRRDQIQKLFDFPDNQDERVVAGWEVVHEGLLAEFPALAHSWRMKIRAAGINWLWPYQEDSLIELLMKPYGAIAAWEQGTGKARLSIALAIMSGKGLICVESGLVPEMVRELKKIRLPESQWQVVRSADETRTLRMVNVISYHRLKAKAGTGKQTLAHLLRRKARMVMADEGGILANPKSQQSVALLRLAPRKLYVLDGTPIGNYPRDILPLAASAVGGGVAHQPYDIRSGLYLQASLINSASFTPRGIDQFRDNHVVLEWATNEFTDDLRSGAKREIPKINNVVKFRDWTSSFLQRRTRYEPEVEPFAGCPRPVPYVREIPWDDGHLRHYLKPAVDFSTWFEGYKREKELEGKGVNFIAVLARINAVIQAANQPHASDKGAGVCYSPLTSKQRYAVDRLETLAKAGKKTILYATSPKLLRRLEKELAARGIEAVLFTGQESINQRTKDLDERFRFGPAPVLLASLGVSQRGLNLEQASHIIFFNRDWTADAEAQAIARTTRPDQKLQVMVEYLHLIGSIDVYMAQVVDWKQAAADSGLDWGDGATESDVFMHMDAVLERFCMEVQGLSSREVFQQMVVA